MDNVSVIQNLIDFVNVAERNRKYAENSAIGFRAALRIFETELNEQEKESLETFRQNIDQISQSVHRKNKDKISVSTIDIYKKRIQKVVSDYDKYANDASKMASWNPATRVRTLKRDNMTSKTPITDNLQDGSQNIKPVGSSMTRFELPLRPDVKAIILTPTDLTEDEAEIIKKYIEYLKSISKK